MEKFLSRPENIYDDNITKRYYETVGTNAESGQYKTEVDKYFESLIPENFNNRIVLDHGCGNGRYGELFYQRGAKKVVGVDLSSSMIQEAVRKKEEKKIQQLEFVQGDINNLPIGEEKFDFVFSRFSLMYSPDIEEVINEISESLKENGEILIETNVAYIKGEKSAIQNNFVPLTLRLGKSEVSIKNYAITIDKYLSAFEKAGLEIEVQKEYPASEITIDDDFEYKNRVNFKVFIFKLIKSKSGL